MTNYAIQEQNQDLVSLLAAHFRLLYNPTHALADAEAILMMLPGLRGLWLMSAVNESGSTFDASNQARTLTANGTVLYGTLDNTLIPTVIFAGTQYLSRADEAGLDITGTEANIETTKRGLTIGGWFRPGNAVGTTEALMSKWAASNLSYNINRQSSGVGRFAITNDGATAFTVDSTATINQTEWAFVCGRFDSSTELAIWVNGEKSINTTSIPASIFSGNSEFDIGAFSGGANPFTGRASLCFLCASMVPDQFITAFYQMTAPLFGISV